MDRSQPRRDRERDAHHDDALRLDNNGDDNYDHDTDSARAATAAVVCALVAVRGAAATVLGSPGSPTSFCGPRATTGAAVAPHGGYAPVSRPVEIRWAVRES
ncbi:hypothetical protein ATCCBAA256_13780 [Mycobacterium montefiorense]|nr:hypothetical protein ATCCBAA256_13780 [Mycobacterium montefiorense]